MKTNYEVMKKIEISDEEIRQQMDFDGLLATHRAITKKSSNQKLKWGIAIATLSIAIAYFTIDINKNANNPTNQKELTTVSEPVPTQIVTVPNSRQIQTEQINKPIETEPIKQLSKAKSIEPKIEVAKEDVYVEPEPVLGYPHLYDYFNTNLDYPQEALKDSIQGVESVSFIINKKGEPIKIEILNTLGVPFDKEVMRLLETMPTWKPATLNGRPVLSKVSVPFTFKIKITSK
jgi:TonB family protein